ncbi:right-handed parallel beta-helix repeat-containing protein [Lederbergia citrea]|uniref:Right-handed parallel beta-helix repeat-containing protein n=1 Tax=Lederbergia citrea TaxID=2833581 RepID=A0A942UNC1_9BACI|nr:right-handed parallel beta-helix repeat-containing protein [Lederbergia citrea]MBS4206036.1 right-handed parallel beta-helix repeat-containing protein [Lederbergia citrea]MBS4224515.1 right-handed parallel beta-helix repeat-containing protein [Lederbergia citrea]
MTRIIDVKDYGGEANSIKDHSPIVYSMLQEIKQIKDDIIISFPEGIYHFYPDHAPKRAFHTSNTDTIRHPVKTVCFLIEELENVTIEGNGSMFIFHGDVMGLGIFHSKNIHIQNLSWDYEVSTLSELMVQSTGEEQELFYADYYLEEYIPYEVSENGQSFYWLSEKSPYSKEYYWKEEGSKNDMVIVGFDEVSGVKRRFAVNEGPFANTRLKIEELSKGKIRIYYDQALPSAIAPNRVFEFCKVIDRNTAGALIWESENICLSNVTIHYLHGFGFLVQMSGDVSFESAQFIPNTAMGKHGSSFADSIHVSGAKGKITINDCTFEHPHDDPINIHGTFTRVQKIIDEKSLEVIYAHPQQAGFPQYHIGDKVVFFNRATMGDEFEEEYEVTNVVHPGKDGNDLQTMQVTVNKKLPFERVKNEDNEFLYVMENVTYTPEVVITNNKFAHVPTRGILCTTRQKVLIENNNFQNITMSTIFISNDSNDWYESGPVRDMTIRGNTFRVTPVDDWNYRKPAIYIHPIALGEKNSPVPIHKNITIENNIFYMHHEYVVSAENVENLIIQNNKIVNMRSNKLDKENKKNVFFEFDTCKNVVISNNTYQRLQQVYARMKRMHESDLMIVEDLTMVLDSNVLVDR